MNKFAILRGSTAITQVVEAWPFRKGCSPFASMAQDFAPARKLSPEEQMEQMMEEGITISARPD